MKKVILKKVAHKIKLGSNCAFIKPNITEDCIFFLDGEPVGFYMKSVSGKLKDYLEIANKEFRSGNVPKTNLDRSDIVLMNKKTGVPRGKLLEMGLGTRQMSCIIGSIPPKPHMRRPYPTRSSVHNVKTAQTYIKAMLLTCREAEKLVQKIMPEQYKKQIDIFKSVSENWKFGKLFTSSISNYNISAPYHRDTGNFKGTVNIILTKRKNSKGGCLNVPDYGITIEQADNSMLVYPAWLNVHGVTPIIETKKGGYRNSLIFYPLKAFKGLD